MTEGDTRGTRRRTVYIDQGREVVVPADIRFEGGRCRSNYPEGKRLPQTVASVEFFLSSRGVVPVRPAKPCDGAALNHVFSSSSLIDDRELGLGRPAVESVRVGLQSG